VELRSLAIIGQFAGPVRRQSLFARIGIVAEEADESVLWLELLEEMQTLSRLRLREIIQEAGKLAAIFSASQRTSKDNR
jgi:hypothetical protein